MATYDDYLNGLDNRTVDRQNQLAYDATRPSFNGSSVLGSDVQANNAWDALGLDSSLYSANQYAVKRGLQLSGADLQSQLLARNEFDYESATNYAYAKQMYDETESYSAKVAQMQEAGLNVALMYGGNMSNNGGADYDSGSASTAGNSASAVQAASALNSTKADFALGAFNQLAQLPAQVQALQSQSLRNKEQELTNKYLEATLQDRVDKIKADLNSTLNENSLKLVELGLKQNELDVSNATKDFDISIRENESLQAAIKTEADRIHVDTDLIEQEYKRIQTDMLKVDQKYQEQFIQLSIQMQAMDMLLKDSQTRLNEEQLKNLAKERKLMQAQIEKLGKEAGLIQKEADYKDLEMFLSYVGRMDEFIGVMLNPDTQRYSQKSSTEFREYWKNSVTEAFGSLRKVWGNSGFYMTATLPDGTSWQPITPDSGWSFGYDDHPQANPRGTRNNTTKNKK